MDQHFYNLTVADIIWETEDAVTVAFENPNNPVFQYKPGQYLTLKAEVNGESLRRPYSLSSSPITDSNLSVTIKVLPDGKFSNYLKATLKKGDIMEVMPPMGKFIIEPNSKNKEHFVLIGAGSGITPLMSILKSVLELEKESKVTLLLGNRSENSIIFKKKLQEFEEKFPERFKVIHTLSQPSSIWEGEKGRLNKDKLKQYVSTIQGKDGFPTSFWICGPSLMMADAEAGLKELGISSDKIHQEFFTTPIHKDEPVEEQQEESYELVTQQVSVILDGKKKVLTVNPDQSILDAAIQAGMDPPYACQLGVCCTCRAKVHSGVVSMDETEGLSDQEMEDGFILSCQAHPLSADVEVEFG